MASYDLAGNIAIVKFGRKEKQKDKKSWALKFLKEHKQIRSVLEKTGKFSGRLRTPTTRFIAGEKTKEVLYRENGCDFRFNVDTCYFSPRLSAERKEIAGKVKKGEKVLVMFGGVAPFAIVIGKLSKADKVVSVELGRDCSRYALENVKRNKLIGKVEIIQGDVKRVVPKLHEKFDRIVMARPNLKDDFLDSAFKVAKKGTEIHYYGFYEEENAEKELKKLIELRAKESGKKVKIGKIKKAGDIGIRKYRYRVDMKIS